MDQARQDDLPLGLDFIIQTPTTWDETRVLHAEIGRCLVIARRKGDAWYLGGMTAAEERELNLPLKFLGVGKFEAELYLDDAARGPTAITQVKQAVRASDTLKVLIPRGRGLLVGRERRLPVWMPVTIATRSSPLERLPLSMSAT